MGKMVNFEPFLFETGSLRQTDSWRWRFSGANLHTIGMHEISIMFFRAAEMERAVP